MILRQTPTPDTPENHDEKIGVSAAKLPQFSSEQPQFSSAHCCFDENRGCFAEKMMQPFLSLRLSCHENPWFDENKRCFDEK
jgi:hypothetical protein